MALAPDRLLGGVVAALGARRGGLDRLAVDHASAGAGRAADPFAVHHQRNVVDRPVQHQPHETPEPPVHRLPGWKVLGQHAPAAARPRHVADRVQHLPQIHLRLSPPCRRLRQQRGDPLAFLVSEIGRIALRLPLDRGHASCRRSCDPQRARACEAQLAKWSVVRHNDQDNLPKQSGKVPKRIRKTWSGFARALAAQGWPVAAGVSGGKSKKAHLDSGEVKPFLTKNGCPYQAAARQLAVRRIALCHETYPVTKEGHRARRPQPPADRLRGLREDRSRRSPCRASSHGRCRSAISVIHATRVRQRKTPQSAGRFPRRSRVRGRSSECPSAARVRLVQPPQRCGPLADGRGAFPLPWLAPVQI